MRARYLQHNVTTLACPPMNDQPAGSIAESVAHPDDVAVDRFAIAMKARLAAQRAGAHVDWRDPARADLEDLAAALMNAIAAGAAVDIAVRCMQLEARGAKPTVLGGAWYACSTTMGEPSGGGQPAPPATLFGALMDLYWQAKLANDQSAGQLEPVFEYETEVITRLLDGDLFTSKASPSVVDASGVEPGVVASLATIRAVTEAQCVVREGPEHVADTVRSALEQLLGELAAARAAQSPSTQA
jgi:hypothetical protein